jgi:hypothetical protein
MEGAGLLTACAALLLAPFEWRQARAQKLRLLTPHELNLRRATQPLGFLALLAWSIWLLGARDIGVSAAAVLLHPSENWPVLLLGAFPLYGLAAFVAGASQCWGMRSDPMLPCRAFVKLGIGAAGIWFLWLWNVDLGHAFDTAPGITALWLLLVAASIWCAVVGVTRFLLLTIGGGNAFAQAARWGAQTQIRMRPVRLGPWWWPFR